MLTATARERASRGDRRCPTKLAPHGPKAKRRAQCCVGPALGRWPPAAGFTSPTSDSLIYKVETIVTRCVASCPTILVTGGQTVVQDDQREHSRNKQFISFELRVVLSRGTEAHTVPPLSPWTRTALVQRLHESLRGRARPSVTEQPPRLPALLSRCRCVTAPKHTSGDAGRSDGPRGSREPRPLRGRKNAASLWFGAVRSFRHPRWARDVSPWVRRTTVLSKITFANGLERCLWFSHGSH